MLLEDRILKIMELRGKDFDDKAIGESIGIEASMVVDYENACVNTLREFFKKYGSFSRVAKAAGISPVVVRIVSQTYSIESSCKRKKSKKLEENLRKIEDAMENGAKSVVEVREQTGLSYNQVYRIIQKNGIDGLRKRKDREKRADEIRAVIAQGAKTVKEIAEIVGLKPNTIYSQYGELLGGISRVFPKGKNPPKRRIEIDELIEEGLTLGEIGSRVNLSRERIRQYIVATGQYEYYRERRRELISGNHLSCIAGQINEIFQRQIPEEDRWAYDMTEKYFSLSRKRKEYSFWDVLNIFKKYQEGVNTHKKLTLEELGSETPISHTTIGLMLKKVGLKPLNTSRIRGSKEKTKAKQELVRKLVSCYDFKLNDFDCLIGMKQSQVYVSYLNARRFSKKKPKIKLKRFFGIEKKDRLNYGTLNEIYEAQNAGFSREEVMELTGISNAVYNYADMHRGEYLPIIEHAKRLREKFIKKFQKPMQIK